jgi:hypothetical protein
MEAPVVTPEVQLDESEQHLLVNLAKRYFKGTLGEGVRRSDSDELVQKMERAMREKMAILERFMGDHGGFALTSRLENRVTEGAQRIIENLFASGELNLGSELSDEDIKNISIARMCLTLMIGNFREANRRHNFAPVNQDREVKRAAQRAVAETGSFYFRDTDQVPFRQEVRQKLVKASELASIVGRDPEKRLYMSILRGTHKILGILGASAEIDGIRGVLKGLYGDRLKDGFAFVVQTDNGTGELKYNTYFRKEGVDSVSFGKPVKEGVKMEDLDNEIRPHYKVETEGTMAIAVPKAVPKMKGDEVEGYEVEFDIYIVESERPDQMRTVWDGNHGG